MDQATRDFADPQSSFGAVDARTTAALLSAAADIALVIDPTGVIRDISMGGKDFQDFDRDHWVGRPWVDTVTSESRPKVASLLEGAKGDRRWRQVNHPTDSGDDIPVLYSTMPVDSTTNLLAVGRDLRDVAALQQRLVEAQMAMERDYASLRNSETRYRMLFELSGEGVVIVKANTREILEANPASARLAATSAERLLGKTFPEQMQFQEEDLVLEMLAAVRSAGTADDVEVQSRLTGNEVTLAASLFRQFDDSFFLIRMGTSRTYGPLSTTNDDPSRQILNALGEIPDGFVLTDLDGLVLFSNRAFADMLQVGNVNNIHGQPLEKWLGRPGVEIKVLISTLREHGSVRLFATQVQGDFGGSTDVEICAVAADTGDFPCLAFSIRDISQRIRKVPRSGAVDLRDSVQPLADLVGQVPLKQLVREASDVVERMCIEAALSITSDNRASAAEVLGLSRQSLYVKLRRHGLLDPADRSDATS